MSWSHGQLMLKVYMSKLNFYLSHTIRHRFWPTTALMFLFTRRWANDWGEGGGGVMSRSLRNSSNYLDTSTIRFFEQVCQPCNQVGFAVIINYSLNSMENLTPKPLIKSNFSIITLPDQQLYLQTCQVSQLCHESHNFTIYISFALSRVDN